MCVYLISFIAYNVDYIKHFSKCYTSDFKSSDTGLEHR